MPNKQTANAKINLCLHVTGQQVDGYHLLDSLVVFADYGDALTFVDADEFSVSIDGPFGAGLDGGSDNLITRAGVALGERGAAVELTKNLPISSGIGGGSADAAATLRGLSALWNVDIPDDLGLSLGADVPVCLAGRSVRMHGVGEQLEPIDFLPAMPAILVNAGDAVSTPTVFSALSAKQNDPIGALPTEPLNFQQAVTYLAGLRNDLQAPATAISPNIADVLDVMNQDAVLARMSGSGATCFGLYENISMAQTAAEKIAVQHPNWWVQAVTLNARG